MKFHFQAQNESFYRIYMVARKVAKKAFPELQSLFIKCECQFPALREAHNKIHIIESTSDIQTHLFASFNST